MRRIRGNKGEKRVRTHESLFRRRRHVYEEPEYEEDLRDEELSYEEPEYAEDAEYTGEAEPGYEESRYEEDTAFREEAGYEETGDLREDPEYEGEPEYSEDPGHEGEPYYEEASYDTEPGYEDGYAYEGGEAAGEEDDFDGDLVFEDDFVYDRNTDYEDGAGYENGVDNPDGYAYADDGSEIEVEDLYDDDDDDVRGPSPIELVALLTAAIVVIAAVAVGVLYMRARDIAQDVYEQAAEQAAEQEAALAAAAELAAEQEAAREAELKAEQAKAQEQAEEPEEEKDTDTEFEIMVEDVTVKPVLRSVQNDLKIKFTNEETGRLIASVPFTVNLTAADGKKSVLSDDDMDGIIYSTGLAAGKYSLSVVIPEGEKYRQYSLAEEKQDITVKDKIEYKKIDVSGEVKTEKEVDVAKEDTQVKPAIESEVTDTVAWVEPSATLVGEGEEEFVEIDRSYIVNPADVTVHVIETGTGSVLAAGSTPQTELMGQIRLMAEDDGKLYIIDENGNLVEFNPEEEDDSQDGDTVTDPDDDEDDDDEDEDEDDEDEDDEDEDEDDEDEDDDDEDDEDNIDWDAALRDKEGRRVFIRNSNGEFVKAIASDYRNDQAFFVKQKGQQYVYTGWQTLNGSTYYFDAEHNKVTGEQIIRGVKYNFGADGALIVERSISRGIDVSRWNGSIDWSKVKAAGVEFAIIRCGYRGSSEGALIEDASFRTNIQGARNAGIKVGVYFYTQAVNEVEAVEEASMVLSQISGIPLNLPVYLDVEPSHGRGDTISVEMRTAVCRAFCSTIQNAGYTAGIYANKTWMEEKIDTPSLSGYRLWIAQYATAVTYNRTGYDMWQYTSKGSVSGISGNVDMNISYR